MNTGVGCHSLLQETFPTQGTEPRSPALQADSLLSEPPGKPLKFLLSCDNLIVFSVHRESGNRELGIHLGDGKIKMTKCVIRICVWRGSQPSLES